MTSKISHAQNPKDGIDFISLPWNLNHPEEHLYIHLTTTTGEWTKEHYDPSNDSGKLFDSVYKYDKTPLPLFPSTTSLNYGTTIWEGLKCYRNKDGKPIVFRPDRNFERFSNGAAQMCLPTPSRELFLRGIQHVLQQNSHIIPPHGEGMKLYVRPMLLGSGQQLVRTFVSPSIQTGFESAKNVLTNVSIFCICNNRACIHHLSLV
jgi:branched-chain amino acid aminotransferase